MPQHRAGTGIAGKHTTIIDAALGVVDILKEQEGVRLTLGKITKTRSNRNRSIKFTDTVSGFEMKIKGNCYVQTFFVIVPEPEKNRSELIKLAHQVFV